ALRTASPVPLRRPIIDSGAVRPEPAGLIVPLMRRRTWRPSRPRSVEVQAARLPEARIEYGNREVAAPLALFGGTGVAEETRARVGPTTPKQLGAKHQTCPHLAVHGPPDSTLEMGAAKMGAAIRCPVVGDSPRGRERAEPLTSTPESRSPPSRCF